MASIKKNPSLFAGLGITLLFLLLVLFRVDFLDVLDLKYYDVMMAFRGSQGPVAEIVIVDIDDDSIDALGRWPWPRSVLADVLGRIRQGGPTVIGLNIILSEPEKTAGLKELTRLKTLFENTVLNQVAQDGSAFLTAINTARQRLDYDRQLASAIDAADNVILPLYLKHSALVADNAVVDDQRLVAHAIRNIRHPTDSAYPQANSITLPIPQFSEAARGLGHINLSYDIDGTARRERPVYGYREIFIPSYTLRLAAAYMGVPLREIRVVLGDSVQLGKLTIPTTIHSEMLINFKGPAGSFKRLSFIDVLNDKVPAHLFENKIVLVSPSAAGIMNPLSTPTDATMPVGEFSANTLWSILSNNFIRRPTWAPTLELLLVVVLGLVIIFVLPRLRALNSAIAFLILIGLLVGGSALLFAEKGLWLGIAYPTVMFVCGYIGVVSLNFFVTETRKDLVEGQSAENNRMLGLSFQSQGLLDMAFDKFRRVPVDEEMKETLYSLALDYERKRQYNKAALVYEYIEEHDRHYKDVGSKKKRLMQASETMVYGDSFLQAAADGDDLLATATDTRPTLGRYEIIKMIGKGAMGTVYLGQDPRIHRTTAIKTFRFSDDYDPDEIESLKTKFFREAESAGTLSHPNIVTIYDAGDEQDLAYIAMEYLEGTTLEKYTQKDRLLPMLKVIDYSALIADALDYAHGKGIVHRDIKPANIMLLNSGVVKITDFGIARITATSQTQTGIVKGTPYYMSPEQISGKKVDGRSDIFSLGTLMYQLLTGALPFKGDNPAALMHQIMHTPHPDPKSINPKVLTPLVKVLDKALQKSRRDRYQSAAHLRDHLREVRQKIDEIMAKKKVNN